jgi:hypothetical protein
MKKAKIQTRSSPQQQKLIKFEALARRGSVAIENFGNVPGVTFENGSKTSLVCEIIV